MASSHQQQQQQEFPFSIESFTYSWCINLNPPSLESLNNSLRFSLDHTLSDYFDIDLLCLEIEPSDDHDYGHGHGVGSHGVLERSSRDSGQSGSGSGLRRCKSFMSKKILKRYLGLFVRMFIWRKLNRGNKSRKRMSSRVDAIVDDQSFNCTADWRISCDSETSIHEAVLNCKRSISPRAPNGALA